MKWLDSRIKKIVLSCVNVYNQDLIKHCQELESNKKEIDELKRKYDFIDTKINMESEDNLSIHRSINKEILNLRGYLDNELKRKSLKIDENNRLLKEDLDSSLTGLTKHLDKKLELLGDKKGIVVGLLKRIAELEGDNNVSV